MRGLRGLTKKHPTYICLVTLVASCAASATAAYNVRPGPMASIPCSLEMRFGSRTEDPSQLHVNLVLVNRKDAGERPCRVNGYPDVELIGPAHWWGRVYHLPHAMPRARVVVLRPGQRAHAVLTWLPGSAGGWSPDYVRVVVSTDRGRSFPMVLPWPYGPVERQDAATHPGTYIGRVLPGRR